MRKNLFKRKKNSRKGVSMVELVISLTMITIVSAAAISIIVSSSNVEADTMNQLYVNTAIENAVECFRYADNRDDFKKLLNNIDFGFCYDDASDVYVYKIGSYRVEVNYGKDSVNKIFHITITATKDREELFPPTTYRKAIISEGDSQ